jgi:hypothetical protein
MSNSRDFVLTDSQAAYVALQYREGCQPKVAIEAKLALPQRRSH